MFKKCDPAAGGCGKWYDGLTLYGCPNKKCERYVFSGIGIGAKPAAQAPQESSPVGGVQLKPAPKPPLKAAAKVAFAEAPPKAVYAPPPKPPEIESPKLGADIRLRAPLTNRFDMMLYRGENGTKFPQPSKRLTCGMTYYTPWQAATMTELFGKLVEHIKLVGGGNTPGYAQYLRAESRPHALAFARTFNGSFDRDFNYVACIKNARTFYWNADLTLGPPAPFSRTEYTMHEDRDETTGRLKVRQESSIKHDYIVLNADSIAASTILGFGHVTKTFEVTLFHDLPLEHVLSCTTVKYGSREVGQLGILTKEQVLKLPTNEQENEWAKKLLR